MKKNTNMGIKNTLMLMSGVALYVLSPILGIFVPPLIEKFICAPPNSSEIYACLTTNFWTGLTIGVVVFIIGTVLILLSLNLHRK